VSETPSELKYSASHEWVRVEGDEVVIGITDHAQAALNDIVFVEMPEVGGQFDTEQEFGVVESVKSVSDLYMPVAGEVTAVNDDLEDAPEIINEEPYGGGWLLRLKPRSMDEVAALLDAGGYLASLE
jgi:glycine cleavage system H protein